MILYWNIRYFDPQDTQLKSRTVWLATESLDPATRIAVETIYNLEKPGNRREILRFRHLFQENQAEDPRDNPEDYDAFGTISVDNYFEDEGGNELKPNALAKLLTKNSNAVMFPAGAKQHDIDYALADKHPIQMDQITILPDQLEILGYFSRDLKEMFATAFYQEGPGTISKVGNHPFVIQTAVTDEEIRSFVTIFRRLYMAGEPANFSKAAILFSEIIFGFPLGKWFTGVVSEYETQLYDSPNGLPLLKEKCTFSRKLLIDVFIYTQYAHQPSAKRVREYQECLKAADGNSDVLFWSFLFELWGCAKFMQPAGMIITNFYTRYCKHHRLSPTVLPSTTVAHPYIGTLEKESIRKRRILNDQAKQLAMHLWEQKGRPEGGPSQFLDNARKQLESNIAK